MASHLSWRGVLGRIVKELLSPPKSPPKASRIGKRLYQIGDEPPFCMSETEDDVLAALILRRAASLTELRNHSKHDAPHKILRQICENYAVLNAYIIFPPEGKKSRGGYRTTIQMSK
jgi:hypothetical protein